jgi:hypothetical protein
MDKSRRLARLADCVHMGDDWESQKPLEHPAENWVTH